VPIRIPLLSPRTFHGGVYLPAARDGYALECARELSPPDVLRVPVQLADEPAQIVVSPGQTVRRGDPLATAVSPRSANIFTPVDGRTLDPAALLDLHQRGAWQRAAALHPEACIGCGVCSYVCSADLPLAEAARDLRRRMLQA
jgi:Na+-translocating ferredoxin:NAD+ oxidoreductase RnfC subunit